MITNILFPGSKLRIGILHARWNRKIIDALVAGASRDCKNLVLKKKILLLKLFLVHLNYHMVLNYLLKTKRLGKPLDAIIPIGVLIKGSTMHFEYICDSTTHQLMKLNFELGIPVILVS